MNEISEKKLSQIQSILPQEEFSKLQEISKELDDAWHKRQVFRTETEARYAVLNDYKFPTKAAKYWQSVREQCVHFDELTTLSFDMRRKQIDLKEVEEKLKNAEGFERERLEIDRDELLFQIASGSQVAKDRVREIMQWSKIKHEVNDGSFDDTNVNTHQAESLFKQVLNRANMSNPEQMSSEEKLSIQGILHGLKSVPVNQELIKTLEEKVK